MKVRILREHINYTPAGTYEVTEERGKYLIAMGVAEEIGEKEKIEEAQAKEKVEFKPTKEKVVRKTHKKKNNE